VTTTANKSVINNSTAKSKPAAAAAAAGGKDAPLGVKIDCKTVLLEQKFQCKVVELWDCFSKTELMSAFTRSDVKLNFEKNGE
jgi:activator of HSP90 ATPase